MLPVTTYKSWSYKRVCLGPEAGLCYLMIREQGWESDPMVWPAIDLRASCLVSLGSGSSNGVANLINLTCTLKFLTYWMSENHRDLLTVKNYATFVWHEWKASHWIHTEYQQTQRKHIIKNILTQTWKQFTCMCRENGKNACPHHE